MVDIDQIKSGSKRFKLNELDTRKIVTGAWIAIAGALITYILQVVGDINFGEYTVMAVALASIVANILRKFLSDYSA